MNISFFSMISFFLQMVYALVHTSSRCLKSLSITVICCVCFKINAKNSLVLFDLHRNSCVLHRVHRHLFPYFFDSVWTHCDSRWRFLALKFSSCYASSFSIRLLPCWLYVLSYWWMMSRQSNIYELSILKIHRFLQYLMMFWMILWTVDLQDLCPFLCCFCVDFRLWNSYFMSFRLHRPVCSFIIRGSCLVIILSSLEIKLIYCMDWYELLISSYSYLYNALFLVFSEIIPLISVLCLLKISDVCSSSVFDMFRRRRWWAVNSMDFCLFVT